MNGRRGGAGRSVVKSAGATARWPSASPLARRVRARPGTVTMGRMDTTLDIAHPFLRRAAIGVHLFVAGWMLINGVAHQIGVLYKAHQGTLAPHHAPGPLLWVGAGLIAAAVALGLGAPALFRPGSPSVFPAFGGLAVLGAVIAAVAAQYGFTFLGGSIALFTLDALFLAAHRVLNG
jgi:hypothetical protein